MWTFKSAEANNINMDPPTLEEKGFWNPHTNEVEFWSDDDYAFDWYSHASVAELKGIPLGELVPLWVDHGEVSIPPWFEQNDIPNLDLNELEAALPTGYHLQRPGGWHFAARHCPRCTGNLDVKGKCVDCGYEPFKERDKPYPDFDPRDREALEAPTTEEHKTSRVFYAGGLQIIDDHYYDADPDQIKENEWYGRSPFIYHRPTHAVYVGAPSWHHDILRQAYPDLMFHHGDVENDHPENQHEGMIVKNHSLAWDENDPDAMPVSDEAAWTLPQEAPRNEKEILMALSDHYGVPPSFERGWNF